MSVVGRLGRAGLSLLFLTAIGFLLFRVIPGDPVRTMTRGRVVSPEQLAELRARLGADLPLWRQLIDYFGDLARGDLGTSLYYRRPVADLIAGHLWPTVLLLTTATLLAALLGGWLGMRAGWRPGGRFDRAATGVAIGLWAMPAFWLGMILLMAFGGLFPVGGYGGDSILDLLHHLVLPCVTLVLVVYAQFLLVMRSSVIGERDSAYLVTARAKGLRDARVLRLHALPNALLPTVTLIFTHLGSVVAGAVTVETVFSWPGLGLLTYRALSTPDLPLLQGTFLVLSASVILLNLAADLLYRVLDPRVRVR